MTSTPATLAGDLLEGAAAIAHFLGWTQQRVYKVHYNGGWPIFSVNGKLTARRSTLLAFVAEQERQAVSFRRQAAPLAEGDPAAA